MLLLVALHAWAYVPDRRYARVMAERRAYPSDLSDARWELIEPVLSAWRAERRTEGGGPWVSGSRGSAAGRRRLAVAVETRH
ncbi:hypothetical protein GCM10010269_34250 [Streptomyces humidus]|uniref:Uncharacterized protein n=1 Tax=Streptomyces humidus TaxID=52259 RepID=A0A918FWI4_9ACTN|nr:hypothetical protein GCM10010269_34250 [Streptomyces humidus]